MQRRRSGRVPRRAAPVSGFGTCVGRAAVKAVRAFGTLERTGAYAIIYGLFRSLHALAIEVFRPIDVALPAGASRARYWLQVLPIICADLRVNGIEEARRDRRGTSLNVLMAPFRPEDRYPVVLDLRGMFREFGASRSAFPPKFGAAGLKRRSLFQCCRRSAWQVCDKA